MKKILILLLAGIMTMSAVTGCSSGTTPEQNIAEGNNGENNQVNDAVDENDGAVGQLTAGLVADTGGVNDRSFNEMCWNGLMQAADRFGYNVSYLESKQEADYGPNLETFLDQGTDIIIGVGNLMGEEVLAAAGKNQGQNYVCIDYYYDNPTQNLIGLNFAEHEPAFLVGYIAGKMTETNKVGFVGGIKFDVIDRFQYGYMAGVKTANPNAEILVQYAEEFGNATKGKAIANQMYQKGADIIFHAAGGTGVGVIEAAKENNKYAIGADTDQNYLAPENVITSAVKHVDIAVVELLEDVSNGTFPGGQNIVYTLKDGAVGISESTANLVPQPIIEEVMNVQKQIINGEITIPVNQAEYEKLFK